MDIRKWDYKTRSYKPYELPADAVVILYTQEMDLEVNCASCFRKDIFGRCYTSRVLHTKYGLGYPVCEVCHEAEVREERESDNAR